MPKRAQTSLLLVLGFAEISDGSESIFASGAEGPLVGEGTALNGLHERDYFNRLHAGCATEQQGEAEGSANEAADKPFGISNGGSQIANL